MVAPVRIYAAGTVYNYSNPASLVTAIGRAEVVLAQKRKEVARAEKMVSDMRAAHVVLVERVRNYDRSRSGRRRTAPAGGEDP